MTDAWPETVNQTALLAGYNQKKEDNRAEQKPSIGAPWRRRRSSIAETLITFQQLLTFTEWDAFETWYTTTLKDGTQLFTRNHPRTGATITASFEERPESGEPVSATKYLVTFSIRAYGI